MAIGLCDRSILEQEVSSYWLLVIGYWLLVIGYWLLVICCQFQCPAQPNALRGPIPHALRGPSSQCPIPNALFDQCPIQILDAGAVEKFLNCFIF